jgi:outer membrane translocation and assembly module TamA
MIYRESIGSDVETEVLAISANHYIPMRKRDVLALRAYTRATGKDAPFFLLSGFGGRTDLRGYESGRYRDRMMYAVQGEYRWQPHDRWIFTGFAGVGEVAPSYSEFFKNILPAAGIGTRFVLSAKHKVNLALDVAVGKHGTEFYFGVGEVF